MCRSSVIFSIALLLVIVAGCEGVTIRQEPAGSPAKRQPACDCQSCPLSAFGSPLSPAQPAPACPTCPRSRQRAGHTVRQAKAYQALVAQSVPYCDIPPEWRERNYAGGSCVHAALETVLHWQGQHQLAAWWRETYAYGEYPERLHSRLDQAGLRFAYTQTTGTQGIAFLEQCCELRLCAAVNIPLGHMQTLVGLDGQFAYLIDNNGAGQVDRWPRERFLQAWTGWAVTIVGQAPPPLPFL